MKRTLPALTLALALVAGPALAGGLDLPTIEPQVIVEETGTSASHDWVVPLMLLAMLAATAR